MKRKGKRILLLRLMATTLFILMIGLTVYQTINEEEQVVAAQEGEITPHFTLTDVNGIEHTISDYEGQGVLINFWGTYCPPCDKEMPELENAFQEYQDQGVIILGVNVGEPMMLVNRFLSDKDITFPILLDRDEDAFKKYGVQLLPTTFAVNSEGVLVKRIPGELTEQKIKEAIDLVKP